MEKIEIALASNQAYIPGMIVTAASIAMAASHSVILSFHICDGNISDQSYQEFCDIVASKHPHTEFIRHKIDESIFVGLPEWQGNRMNYMRLLLDKLMPKSEHVIYCDVDFLWLADIAELWKLRDNTSILMSVPESCKETLDKEEKWFFKHNLPFAKDSYICSGLAFFNLRLARTFNLREKAYHWLRKYPDVIFPDQSALNSILFNQIRILPTCWQQLTVSLDSKNLKKPIVLHYAGENPWKRGLWIEMLTDTIILWHKYNAKIHSRTLYWSLHQNFSLWEILYRRSIFHIMQYNILRYVFFLLLKISGRKSYCMSLMRWNIKIKNMAALLE